VGALLGGVLVSALGWRAAFFVNVPVAITIMVVTPLVVAESVRPQRSRLDVPGAVTVTGGLLALVYGIVERQLGAAVVGVVLLAAFVVIVIFVPPTSVSVSAPVSATTELCPLTAIVLNARSAKSVPAVPTASTPDVSFAIPVPSAVDRLPSLPLVSANSTTSLITEFAGPTKSPVPAPPPTGG
jgi:uncharacterized membrane protein (UPF0136 family)